MPSNPQSGGHEVILTPEQQERIREVVEACAAEAESLGVDLRGVDWGRVIRLVFEMIVLFRKVP